MENAEPLTEGWQEYKHPSQRKYHYIGDDSFSLCRGLGFYTGSLMAWTGKAKSPEDCAKCYKLAAKRNEKNNGEK